MENPWSQLRSFPWPFFQNQDSFGDSIAAWEEAANIKQQQGRTSIHRNMITVDDDPLIVETHDLICSNYEPHDSSRLASHSVHSLKNTIHLKALSTALQMAKSHHAVAVEVVMAAEEELTAPSEEHLIKFRVAVNHHMRALELICETAASNPSSGGRKSHFVGAAAKRVTEINRVTLGGGRRATHGCDLGVVSYDHTTNICAQTWHSFADRSLLLLVAWSRSWRTKLTQKRLLTMLKTSWSGALS